ncbi:MAG: TraR/DksA family transcriptional regulator [Treponema sp.]|nr:TraR/DksA family transcriptional regulator [Treponema sp.]
MKKDFVEKQKKKLITQRNQILETLADHSEQSRKLDETKDSGDIVDIASGTIDRALLDSLGYQDQQRLTMINGALDRIQQGNYGLCLRCGKSIPEGRLEAIPYAALCVTCQQQLEHENK